MKHINYLHDFQRQFVLVPADKAANNFIVVCKKFYLNVVLNELSNTDTHLHDDRCSQCVILDHLQYINKLNINVEPEHEDLAKLENAITIIIISRKRYSVGLAKAAARSIAQRSAL